MAYARSTRNAFGGPRDAGEGAVRLVYVLSTAGRSQGFHLLPTRKRGEPTLEESEFKALFDSLHPLDLEIARELRSAQAYGFLSDGQVARLLPLLTKRRTFMEGERIRPADQHLECAGVFLLEVVPGIKCAAWSSTLEEDSRDRDPDDDVRAGRSSRFEGECKGTKAIGTDPVRFQMVSAPPFRFDQFHDFECGLDQDVPTDRLVDSKGLQQVRGGLPRLGASAAGHRTKLVANHEPPDPGRGLEAFVPADRLDDPDILRAGDPAGHPGPDRVECGQGARDVQCWIRLAVAHRQ